MSNKGMVWSSITLATTFLIAATVTAHAFPERPVQLLVGFPQGGPSDTLARLIAPALAGNTFQPVAVSSRTGSSGMVALKEMLAHPADGHTLLLCSYLDISNLVVLQNPGYRLADLKPIGLVAKSHYAFAVPSSSTSMTMKELVDHARNLPGTLKFGSVGQGSITELQVRKLERMKSISLMPIHYPGVSLALSDVAAGKIDLMVGPVGATMPFLRSGKLRMLGVTSSERLDVAIKVPTLMEQGFTFARHGWWGLCARAGVPQEIVRQLSSRVRSVVESRDYRWTMAQSGTFAAVSSPDDMNAEVHQTMEDFRALGAR